MNECPVCGGDSAVRWEEEDYTLGHPEYGGVIGGERLRIPVWSCTVCGFQWTDREAEAIRDAAHARIMAARR